MDTFEDMLTDGSTAEMYAKALLDAKTLQFLQPLLLSSEEPILILQAAKFIARISMFPCAAAEIKSSEVMMLLQKVFAA